jgi:Rrf2 family protein
VARGLNWRVYLLYKVNVVSNRRPGQRAPTPVSLSHWRIMISQKAKYALRALVALAKHPVGKPVFISEIAESQGIPKKFLEQILLELKHHGLVVSKRGKAGGYGLLRPADTISFGEVLRIIDGPIAPLPCLSKIAYRRCEDCKEEASCEVRRVFAQVADATRAVLDRTTISDAVGADLPIRLRDLVA